MKVPQSLGQQVHVTAWLIAKGGQYNEMMYIGNLWSMYIDDVDMMGMYLISSPFVQLASSFKCCAYCQDHGPTLFHNLNKLIYCIAVGAESLQLRMWCQGRGKPRQPSGGCAKTQTTAAAVKHIPMTKLESPGPWNIWNSKHGDNSLSDSAIAGV